jgi:hypothetical protein
MKPPDAFIEEYWEMRERMDWAAAGLGRGQNVAQAKLLVEDFRAFYQKWHPVIKVPELCAGLEAAREHIEKNLARGLEKVFLAHLLEVIEAREDWWTSEQLLQMSINFINMMKHAPPTITPGVGENSSPAHEERIRAGDVLSGRRSVRRRGGSKIPQGARRLGSGLAGAGGCRPARADGTIGRFGSYGMAGGSFFPTRRVGRKAGPDGRKRVNRVF